MEPTTQAPRGQVPDHAAADRAESPDVSVIVPTYNRAELLGRTLAGLVVQQMAARHSYEIVVVDDGSTDETARVVQQIAEKSAVPVCYLREQGHGVARARNAGIAAARGRWIAFFDDDQLAEPDWLEHLLSFASEHGHHCVAGAVRLILPENAGPLPLVCRTMFCETMSASQAQPWPRGQYPASNNVIISRSLIEAVGGFTNSALGAGSDTIFFSRVCRAGFVIWYEPRALVHHIIPPYRLREDYLLRYAYRHGAGLAFRDYDQRGAIQAISLSLARIAQSFIITVPLLIRTALKCDRAERLGSKCNLWRQIGYVTHLMHLLAPRALPTEVLYRRLDFRSDRQAFMPWKGTANPAEEDTRDRRHEQGAR